MQLPSEDQSSGWPGLPVQDDSGVVLGECVGVFADAETGVTDWLDISVPGHGRVLVPALDAVEVDGQVQVRCARALVLSAPRVQAELELMERDEIALYDHYGVAYTDEQSATLLPVGVEIAADAPAPRTRRGSAPISPPVAVPAPAAVPPAVAVPAAAPPLPPTPRRTPDLPAPAAPGPLSTPATRPDPVQGRAPAIPPAASATPAAATPRERLAAPAATDAGSVGPGPAGTGPAASGSGAPPPPGALSALTPLGIVVGLAVAVAVGRSAQDLRARRRGLPTARVRRTTARAALVAGRRWARAPRAAAGAQSALGEVLEWTSRAAAGSTRRAARGAIAAPRSAAVRGRRVRRALVRPLWRGVLVVGFGAGYTAGARAGTRRYEQLRDAAGRMAGSSAVRRSGTAAAQQARRGAAGAGALLRSRASRRWPDPGAGPSAGA